MLYQYKLQNAVALSSAEVCDEFTSTRPVLPIQYWYVLAVNSRTNNCHILRLLSMVILVDYLYLLTQVFYNKVS